MPDSVSSSSGASTSPQGSERRQHPRANAEWPISIALEDGRYEARLRDISAAGICFFLDRRIPEMTVLGLELSLPSDERPIRCTGAVVRCIPIGPHVDHFEVAVFLHDIAEPDRVALRTFVERTLASPA